MTKDFARTIPKPREEFQGTLNQSGRYIRTNKTDITSTLKMTNKSKVSVQEMLIFSAVLSAI